MSAPWHNRAFSSHSHSQSFLILLMQKSDFEILAHKYEICALNERYSSKRTPSNMKLDSGPSLFIRSICEIRLGSSGRPGSLLLNTSVHSASFIFFPWVLKIIIFNNFLHNSSFLPFPPSLFATPSTSRERYIQICFLIILCRKVVFA